MALRGIKVLELAGLAPGPLCGMILADFGATVTRVDRITGISDLDCLKNGKRSLAVDLKKPEGVEIIRNLAKTSDVLIEPFRKGVMESLGLGPNELLQANPRLIYSRLTGFGQNGPYAHMAGHDINYVALSGVLSFLGRSKEKPTFPVNLLADFGGGALTCCLGILMALIERNNSGKGQTVDAAMVEGTAYLSSWLFRSQDMPIWGQSRGKNVLDTGSHFYDTYETKDGKYVAIGSLEPQFYDILIEKLNLTEKAPPHFGDFENSKALFEEIFKQKTRDEWCNIFDGTDACFSPVLDPQEAAHHPHNVARNTFSTVEGKIIPNPAPKLSRTPAVTTATQPNYPNGTHTKEILKELGYSDAQIKKLDEENIIRIVSQYSKL